MVAVAGGPIGGVAVASCPTIKIGYVHLLANGATSRGGPALVRQQNRFFLGGAGLNDVIPL